MKKRLMLLLPVFMLLVVGCSKGNTITCTLETEDSTNGYKLNAVYKINYTNGVANYVESEETINSSNAAILSNFESVLKSTYETSNSTYGGYTYDIKRTDSSVTAKVKVDYSVVNIKQLIEDQPSLQSYVKDGKLTVDGIKSLYTALGAKCN